MTHTITQRINSEFKKALIDVVKKNYLDKHVRHEYKDSDTIILDDTSPYRVTNIWFEFKDITIHDLPAYIPHFTILLESDSIGEPITLVIKDLEHFK